MNLEELELRLAAVEAELPEIRQEAAAARALAAGADRDVADYRAEMRSQTRMINALRETQVEQGQVQAEQGQVQAEQGQALSEIKTGMTQIVGLLNELISRDGNRDADS
jgi:hypothetical protein